MRLILRLFGPMADVLPEITAFSFLVRASGPVGGWATGRVALSVGGSVQNYLELPERR